MAPAVTAAVTLAIGPLVALVVGIVAWSIARLAAPPPHANDNAPLPASIAAGRHEQRRAGGLSVIGADVALTGDVATQGDLPVDGRPTQFAAEGRAAESPLRLVDAG